MFSQETTVINQEFILEIRDKEIDSISIECKDHNLNSTLGTSSISTKDLSDNTETTISISLGPPGDGLVGAAIETAANAATGVNGGSALKLTARVKFVPMTSLSAEEKRKLEEESRLRLEMEQLEKQKEDSIRSGSFKFHNRMVAIRSHAHDTYMCADGLWGFGISIDRRSVDDWEKFEFIPAHGGTHVQFRTHKKMFISALPDHTLIANRKYAGDNETFKLVRLESDGPDVFAFQTVHGRYLCAEPRGQLEADREKLDGWEKFVIELLEIGNVPDRT